MNDTERGSSTRAAARANPNTSGTLLKRHGFDQIDASTAQRGELIAVVLLRLLGGDRPVQLIRVAGAGQRCSRT